MQTKKILFAALGIIFLMFGAAGVVLPMLPTTPFVLLSAVCFGKSSSALHGWFLSTRIYRKHLEHFANQRMMPAKTKWVLLGAITFFMGASFLTMVVLSAPIFARVILGIVWLCHVLYFGVRVKTMR